MFLSCLRPISPWWLRANVDRSTLCLAAIAVYENPSSGSKNSISSIAAWIELILVELSACRGLGSFGVRVHYANPGITRTDTLIKTFL